VKKADKVLADLVVGKQPTASSDVYVVGKWTVDRVLKKIDDIKKPGTTIAKKS